MEQSVGDSVNVEFGEPRLADNVIRGHIRFEQGLNSYGDHFCHPNHIPLLRWGQRIEARSLSRQSRIHAIRTNHVSVGMEFKAEPNLCTKVTAPHCTLGIPNSDARFRKDWKTTREKIRITGERRSASHAIL